MTCVPAHQSRHLRQVARLRRLLSEYLSALFAFGIGFLIAASLLLRKQEA